MDRYNPSSLKERDTDAEELDDLLSILLELRSLFRNLQWYSEVNRRGFVKILKKLDKKVNVQAKTRYLNSKVLILPFANASSVNSNLALVNSFIDQIAPMTTHQPPKNSSLHSNTEMLINSDIYGNSNKLPTAPPILSNSPVDTMYALRAALPNDDASKISEVIALKSPSQPLLLATLYKAVSFKSFDCIKILLGSITSLADPSDLNSRNFFHRIVLNHARQRASTISNNGIDSLQSQVNSTYNNLDVIPIDNRANNSVSSTGSSTPTSNNSDQQFNRSLYINPAVPPITSVNLSSDFGKDGVNSNDDVEILVFILNTIDSGMRNFLVGLDAFKRTPLHYSAQYGLKSLTKALIHYMKEWNLVDSNFPFYGSHWKDNEGMIPLQLSIKGNHPLTTGVILEAMNKCQVKEIPGLLHIASRLGSQQLVELLLSYDLDVNDIFDSQTNESCLYTASKLNLPNIVELLLKAGADSEIREKTYGWSPVFVAAVEGFEKVVSILVENGCDISKVDGSGWNAMEHACLRGHLNLVDILKPPEETSLFFGRNNNSQSNLLSSNTEFPETASSTMKDTPWRSSSPIGTLNLEGGDFPVKTFGHRYLKETSMILVNLGSMDVREKNPPIQLDGVSYSKVSSTQLDTALSLIISAKDCEGEPVVIDLPLTDGQSMEQFSFYTKAPENSMLFFDLVPTYSGSKTKILGRAVGLLSELINKVGENKTSLFRTITLPILETSTLEVLGKIRFQFLIVRPFHHPNIGVAKSSTYWKSLTTTRVIGHRGLGKNSLSTQSLQLGENTLQSFIAAANLGASYVEFDVQLTKDFVPVIYHDFLVGETGIDIPMQSLTLEQFLNISDQQQQTESNLNYGRAQSPQPRKSKNLSLINDTEKIQSNGKDNSREKHRSMSLFGTNDDFPYSVLDQRMKYTRDFKLRGFKANTRGHSIQAPFTTLEEVFRTLPKHVGFNIECKYPMLDESQAEDMDNFAIELNFWVDTVLKTVYDHAQGRDIIFSSFHPEICILLSLKQPSIPVLFLTEGGTAPMMDIRATSLQEAIRLARRWNLLGIVSECTPLIKCPRLVRAVKDSGIVCVTYGTQNNDPVNSRLQMQYGVDAVIVDSVLAVRKGLTEQSADLEGSLGENGVSDTNDNVSPSTIIDNTASTMIPDQTVGHGAEPTSSKNSHTTVAPIL